MSGKESQKNKGTKLNKDWKIRKRALKDDEDQRKRKSDQSNKKIKQLLTHVC